MTQEQYDKAWPYIKQLNELQEQIHQVENALTFPKNVMMIINPFRKIRLFNIFNGEDIKVFYHPSYKLIRRLLEEHLECLREEESIVKAELENL